MSIRLPNGALVAIAAGYDTSVAVSALSNANPAAATSATQAFSEGDILEVTSGWSRLTGKAVRVGASPTTTSFDMEGIDTSLTSIYSPGGGIGSVRKVTSFTQLAQILTVATDGGDQQFLDYQLLEDDAQKRIPTFKNASGLTLSVADDPTQPGYQLASAANDDRLPRIVKFTLPDGSVILYNAYISINKTPSLTVNEIMAVQVTFSLVAEVVRYAS